MSGQAEPDAQPAKVNSDGTQAEARPTPPEQPSNAGDAEPGAARVVADADGRDDEDGDDETCGFCVFMKAGGCRKAFTDWSKCVDSERDKGGDFATDCREKTFALRECMLQHRDYYAPLLEEEAEALADKEEAAAS